MERDFTQYCEAESIAFTNAFHHAKLVAAKKVGAPSSGATDERLGGFLVASPADATRRGPELTCGKWARLPIWPAPGPLCSKTVHATLRIDAASTPRYLPAT